MSIFEKYLDMPFEEIIGDRFGRYSKYIIQDRAIPDVRDGLKPVQRRILYAMLQEGNTADKAYRKSAKTVGTVIGNYHPHGDSSVYDALVRLSQDWKMRHLLVEMHGNNGSMDGDPQAAMRYTEARLSPIAMELLRDIDRDTVTFAPNFDDTTREPTVLPARFPNLLVNGSTGISSGYATDIPPHHLGEVLDAVMMQIDDPAVSLEDLMQVIKGPDFPTGGIIQGVEGIKQAYKTGKGKIVIRAKTTFEVIRGGREQIIITELPYDVNKANLVRKIDEYRLDRKVEGIAEVRDESDRTGLRIVVDLKKEADSNGVLNFLFKHTDLQIYYHFNMVAIHKQTPRQLSLKEILQAYVEHQQEVVTHRCRYDLAKAEHRRHIVEGLIKAISVLDEVIQTIRASKNKADAKQNLIDQFHFTDRQAEAIVMLQLYRLTNTDIVQLEEEAARLHKEIEQLQLILNDERQLFKVIKKELKQIKATFADERRTVIQEEVEELKINLEVIVPPEDVIVSVTRDGYVKRTGMRSYAASEKGEIGKKEEDELLHLCESNTTHSLLLFTNLGQYIFMPVHELPDIRWKDIGQHIANFVPIGQTEKIIAVHPVPSFQDTTACLVFFTRSGMAKRSLLAEYEVKRYSRPLQALKLKAGDELLAVHVSDGQHDVVMVTEKGYLLRFDEEEISVVGQKAQGVIGMNVKADDQLLAAFLLQRELPHKLYMVTQRGATKKVDYEQIEKMARARRGKALLKDAKRTTLEDFYVITD